MSAIDRVKELLAAVKTEHGTKPGAHGPSACPGCEAKLQLEALAIPFAEALVALAEHAEVHDRDCCQQLARLEKLEKAMGEGK